jgi:hypothetical protein
MSAPPRRSKPPRPLSWPAPPNAVFERAASGTRTDSTRAKAAPESKPPYSPVKQPTLRGPGFLGSEHHTPRPLRSFPRKRESRAHEPCIRPWVPACAGTSGCCLVRAPSFCLFHRFKLPFPKHLSVARLACAALLFPSFCPPPMKGWAERREARIFKSRLRGAMVHAYEARRAPDLGPAALASRRSNLALRGGPRFRLASVRASYLSPATATGQNLAHSAHPVVTSGRRTPASLVRSIR